MSERFEDEVMDDLFYEEAEGAADFYGDDFYGDEFEDEEEWEGVEEDYFEDEFEDDYDEYEYSGEEDEYTDEEEMLEEELEDAVAYALGAEDTDEFLGKLWKGIKRVAKKVAPVIGRIARRAAPVAGLIPGYGTAISTGLKLLGRLRAEGATVEEALEAFAELAAYDEAVKPIVSGLAVRALVKNKAKKMPKPVRKKMVKDISKATKILVQKSGREEAIRAIPKIVNSVKKKRTPVVVRPKMVKKIAVKVARNPRLNRKLSRPSPKGKKLVKMAIARRR